MSRPDRQSISFRPGTTVGTVPDGVTRWPRPVLIG